MEESAYAIRVRTSLPYAEARERFIKALKDIGFGVQWEIDAKEGLKQMVGEEFRHYSMLGTCDPKLAWRAFQQELEVGLMLPCSAIVYEDEGGSVAAVMDPRKLLALTGNPALDDVAAEAHRRLVGALGALERE